jgi:uncharacterized protein
VRKVNDRWVISPRDLIAELECSHRLHLEWSVLENLIAAPEREESEELELLAEQGKAHESKIAAAQKAAGSFIDIGSPTFTHEGLQLLHNRTVQAIADGVETIYQATFYTEDFLGFADFLILNKDESGNPVKDSQGRFIYDPVDAKSARSAKRAAVLQVAAYAAVMQEIGLATPLNVHLWLGGDKRWSASALDLIDLATFFMDRVRARINGYTQQPSPDWAPPRESCTRCRWSNQCDLGRHNAQDLSLIQGIRSSTRTALVSHGITTLQEMADATDEQRPRAPREVSKETFSGLRDQASIQIRGKGSKKPIFEVRDETAFGLMPQRSKGDIWFDMEGDPFANDGSGLEYMFGFLYKSEGNFAFHTFDARNTAEEKVAFSNFINYVSERRKEHPDMHVYHYAAYEVSAMLRLAQRHGILEFEVDKLIREGVFVDLYSIVRNAFRFSTESMSIKYIEKVYWDGNRDKEVSNAVGSVIQFEKALALLNLGDEPGFISILEEIKSYNKDDVDSTRQLDDWIRSEAQARNIDIESLRPEAAEKWEATDEVEREEPIALQLLNGVPDAREDRTEEEQGLALLSAAISFHHREARPAWWAIFDRALKDKEEMDSFNDVVLPTNVDAGPWTISGRQRNHRRMITIEAEGVDLSHILDHEHIPQLLYEFAPEGFKTIQGSTRGFIDASIIEIDGSKVIFEEVEKKSSGTWEETPMAILPGAPIRTTSIEKVLREVLGSGTIARRDSNLPVFPKEAWADVLLRRAPRQRSGSLATTDDSVSEITSSLLDSDNSYVAVQGPPGTGKTYVGAHVIAELARAGWKIGVVAQSHAVVEHLMDSVKKLDDEIPMAKKGQSVKSQPSYHVDDVAAWALGKTSGYVIGGTVWTYSRDEIRLLGLDLMVIDEAGQFSLANSLAAISAAKRALLLGDPQQLPQVSQGKHPEPVNESVLAHILGNQKTMPSNLGYFLDTTFRLHPLIAKAVSRLQYEDRLHADARCSKRSLMGVEPGIHVIDVEHLGNTVTSIEEADELLARIPLLIGTSWTPVSGAGEPETARPLTEEDILVVTGYNAQVRYLKSRLKSAGFSGIKVGTVDKFQGQEAPVVFLSMVTSSSEDLPRGIEFLLSPNRLNVAISRAQWACYILRSPHLAIMEPTSPDGMVMLGKFVTLTQSLSSKR